jgi:hypothetical protein
MKQIKLILFIGLLILGCTKMAPEFAIDDSGQDCTPQFPEMEVTYNNYVRNVIVSHCTESCHKGGNSLGPGDFRTFEGLKPYVGDVFYYRVVQDRADMPQGKAPLPKAIRDSLNIWIKNCGPQG